MKIVIASPYLHTMRGNTLTAKRMINTIQDHHVKVKGINYNDLLEVTTNEQEILQSDFLHILNPIRYIDSEMFKMNIHVHMEYGITFTGTDINVYLTEYDRNHIEFLENASFIAVFHEQAYKVVTELYPQLVSRVHVISQGYYEIEDEVCEKEKKVRAQQVLECIAESQQQGKTVIALPAGIRKIKQIPWAIQAVCEYEKIYGIQVVLCIIGPVIEEEEMDIVNQLVSECEQTKYFGDVSHSAMLKIIKLADVVLNCSESEGQSLAVIEAFYQQTLAIASRCPGNEQMIDHGENGYLFTNKEDFFYALNESINKPEKTEEMLQTAYQAALERYSAEYEKEQYVRLYKQALDKKKAIQIVDILERMYPDAECELTHSNAFELLIATILSAQCTDQRVNQVTSSLFQKYKTPFDYTKVSEEQIAEDIYGLGLYKNKSKAIKKTATILVDKHNGEVPDQRTALENLPGVGRKTANVVLSNAFGVPAIAVDTHVFRVSNRLGLATSSNVLETEQQLMTIIPKERWSQAHHQLIFHGRRICHARKPKCSQCQLASLCPNAHYNQ